MPILPATAEVEIYPRETVIRHRDRILSCQRKSSYRVLYLLANGFGVATGVTYWKTNDLVCLCQGPNPSSLNYL